MTCLNMFGCRSPLACDGFGYCRERHFTTVVETIHARCECCGGHGQHAPRPGAYLMRMAGFDPAPGDCADCQGLGVIPVEVCPLTPEDPAVLAGDSIFQHSEDA